MRGEVLGVGILVRVSFGAQEEHVLSWLCRVIDVRGRGRLGQVNRLIAPMHACVQQRVKNGKKNEHHHHHPSPLQQKTHIPRRNAPARVRDPGPKSGPRARPSPRPRVPSLCLFWVFGGDDIDWSTDDSGDVLESVD